MMESIDPTDDLLPPALLAEVEALAAVQQRSAREMLREAVEHYLKEYRSAVRTDREATQSKRTPQEAAARLMELRKGNFLPQGTTIRDLMIYGRA